MMDVILGMCWVSIGDSNVQSFCSYLIPIESCSHTQGPNMDSGGNKEKNNNVNVFPDSLKKVTKAD